MVPKHDPSPLAALIAASTTAARRRRHAVDPGLSAVPAGAPVRDASTTSARGRFGWNIVTSGEDTAAQNFGLDKLPPRELRYEMADEYMDVVNQLLAPGTRMRW